MYPSLSVNFTDCCSRHPSRMKQAHLNNNVRALHNAPQLAPDLQILLKGRQHQALSFLNSCQGSSPQQEGCTLLRVYLLRALLLIPLRPPGNLQSAPCAPTVTNPLCRSLSFDALLYPSWATNTPFSSVYNNIHRVGTSGQYPLTAGSREFKPRCIHSHT